MSEEQEDKSVFSGFGLWGECDPEAKVAWGARGIVRGDSIDLVHDRMTWHGTTSGKDAFRAKLYDGALETMMSRFTELRRGGKLRGDESSTYILFEGNGLIIKANTRASHGYVYIIAYPTETGT